MTRIYFKCSWIFFLGFCLALTFTCTKAEAGFFSKNDKKAKLIIVFLDMSGSTNKDRKSIYKNAFDMIYKKLDQDDRIVVGTITSHSYIDFKPRVDEKIPKKSIWVNRLKYEKNLTRTRKKIKKEVNRLLSYKHGTRQTEILNSLNIADTIFHNEKNRMKILVLLSDMIQDSREYKFDKTRITNKYIENLIKNRKKQELIPDLKGVKIYVAGASASGSRKFRAVKLLWTRYFKTCNADFSTHRYGHSLLEFENNDN